MRFSALSSYGVVILVGCGEPATVAVAVARIEPLANVGDQSAEVGSPVPFAPGVVVRDADGKTVSRVSVSFEVTVGGGSVTPTSAVTDALGEARVDAWVLGERSGTNTFVARAAGLTTTISAVGRPGAPAALEKVGDAQTVPVKTSVPSVPGVVVRDRFSNPVPDVAVAFAVLTGGGRLASTSSVSNALGFATPGVWTLGTSLGPNSIRATVATIAPVDLLATATAGPAARMTKIGDLQSAIVDTDVPRQLEVGVEDEFGNPVPNVTVVFQVLSGGGSVTGSSVATSGSGLARLGSWRLGTTAGPNELRATAGSLSTTFSAAGLPDQPALLSLVLGNQQTDTIQATLPVRPTVRVTDRFFNIVAGVTVSFRVTGGGGQASGDALSDAVGLASTTWTLGATAGPNTVTAALSRVTQTVVFAATAEWPPFRATRVVAGHDHTCALNTLGRAYCWGDNSLGQLGDGSRTDRLLPTAVTGSLVFSALEAGHSHTCAIATGGVLYCWGYNQLGQVGDGSLQDRNAPVLVGGGLRFKSVVAGSGHTCGVTDVGAGYCWGMGGWGQLGNGVFIAGAPTPVSGGIAFLSLDAGDLHTCGLSTNGATYCWGEGGGGRIGDGGTVTRPTAVPVAGGHAFVVIGAGGTHSCGLVTGGQLYCWGGMLQEVSAMAPALIVLFPRRRPGRCDSGV